MRSIEELDVINFLPVMFSLGKHSTNKEIYIEDSRLNPQYKDYDDRQARIRTMLQRYCPTSAQYPDFGGKRNLQLFINPSRGVWGLLSDVEETQIVFREENTKLQSLREDIAQRGIRERRLADTAKHNNQQTSIREGYIYIISNPAWPGFAKLGMSVDGVSRFGSYQTYSPRRD